MKSKIPLTILLIISLFIIVIIFNPKQSTPVTENQTPTPTTTSETFIDPKSGITFSAPSFPKNEYVSSSDWPPKFVNSTDLIKCELDEQTQAMSGATSSSQIINGTTYCFWKTNEGAAGSTYTNYQITYPQDSQYFTMSFTLRYPQCGNYPENEVDTCKDEQENFPLNKLIDDIAQSAHLPQ